MAGQGKGEPRLSPRRVTARLKQLRAAEARADGLPWAQVAVAAGYRSEAAAINAANKILDRLPPADDAAKWRMRELVRLEGEYQALLPAIVAEDTKAIAVADAIHRRIARLLGLDPLPSLNSVSSDVVQGVLDAVILLAARLMAEEQRAAFMQQVETTLLQLTDGTETR